MRKEIESYICPVCGAILYPSNKLFVGTWGIAGCETCFSDDGETWNMEMTVREYFEQNYVSHVDGKIDDILEGLDNH